MWRGFLGHEGNDQTLVWNAISDCGNLLGLDGESEGLICGIFLADSPATKYACIQRVKKLLTNTRLPEPVTWLIPNEPEWELNLEAMKASKKCAENAVIQNLDWLHGKLFLEPEYTCFKSELRMDTFIRAKSALLFYITPGIVNQPIAADEIDSSWNLKWEKVRELAPGGQGATWLVNRKSKQGFAASIILLILCVAPRRGQGRELSRY